MTSARWQLVLLRHLPELLPEQVRVGQAQDEHARQRRQNHRPSPVRLLPQAAHLHLRNFLNIIILSFKKQT